MPRYKYTQESGEDFRVISPDKADAQEDCNEVRQVLDDLGNLLGHSERKDLYPKDRITGGKLAIPESQLNISNIVFCSDYEHPDDAIIAIDEDNKTLLVTEAETCDTNFTVPANVMVKFERGGKWTINDGITVTFNGQIDAGLWQIFEYVESGTLAGTPKIKEVYPQWWGALGDDTNDDTAAIQSAYNFISTGGGTVIVPTGTYKITSAITTTTSGFSIRGIKDKTVIKQYTANANAFTIGGTNNNIHSSGMSLLYAGVTDSTASGLSLSGISKSEFRDIDITLFSSGVRFNLCGDIIFDNIVSHHNKHYGFFSPYNGEGAVEFWSWTIRFLHCKANHNVVDGWRLNNTADIFFNTCYSVGNTVVGFNIGVDNTDTLKIDTVMFADCQSDSNGNVGYLISKYRFIQMTNIWAGSGRTDNQAGIVLTSCDFGNLTNIQALNNGAEGIRLIECNDISGSNFICTGNQTVGFSISDITRGTFNNINTSQDTEVGYYVQDKGFRSTGTNIEVLINNLVSLGNTTYQVENIGTGVLITKRGQVAFPATAVPSTDVNTLDDYEEGTWIPVYTSTGAEFTYGAGGHTGTYVKIGKIVFITFNISTIAVGGTTSNVVTITGLPFVPANETGISFAVSNIAYIPMGAIATDNVIYLRCQNTLTQLVAVDLAGDGQFLVGSGFYSI